MLCFNCTHGIDCTAHPSPPVQPAAEPLTRRQAHAELRALLCDAETRNRLVRVAHPNTDCAARGMTMLGFAEYALAAARGHRHALAIVQAALAASRCEGCDHDRPDVQTYEVELVDGNTVHASWCAGCAEIAEAGGGDGVVSVVLVGDAPCLVCGAAGGHDPGCMVGDDLEAAAADARLLRYAR